MKRKFLNVFVMSILLVVVLACDSLNSSESLLLGKWKNVILDDNVKVESITEYKKDRTFCSSMKVEIVANLNDAEIVDTLDIQELIEIRISLKGTWSLKDKVLEEDTKTFNIKGIPFKEAFNDILCENPADIKINGNDLIALINLILEKERADKNPNKLSITARKYIGLA